MVDGGGRDGWAWGEGSWEGGQVVEGPEVEGDVTGDVTGVSTPEDSFWGSCNYTYDMNDEWHGGPRRPNQAKNKNSCALLCSLALDCVLTLERVFLPCV